MKLSKALRGGVLTYSLACSLAAALFAVLVLAISLAVPATYQASARMIVSVTSNAPQTSASYQETTVAQQLALSLVPLANSEVVTEPVVQSLQLPTTATELSQRVTATVEPETVLIDLSVTDTSNTQAREITNALALQYSDFVSRLQPNSGLKPSVTLVQPAVTPDSPVAPNIARNVALAVVAGDALGALCAATLGRRKPTVSSKSAVAATGGRPVLGALPFVERQGSRTVLGDRTDSDRAEASGELRTNLVHAVSARSRAAIAFTSPGMSEGKTWVARETARSLSEAGYGVIVVDADLRTGGFSLLCGAASERGLSEALRGTYALRQLVRKAEDAAPYMFLPAGVEKSLPSEVLSSTQMRTILEELSRDFDYVLIDTPPGLVFTDAAVVATHGPSVVVVTRYLRTTLENVESLVETLKLVDAKILGSVINFSPIPTARRRMLEALEKRDAGVARRAQTDDR